jgi:hypothetical protein
MWDPQQIQNITPMAIQKRIPFAHSLTDVSNFIGNFQLNPEMMPTNIRSKYIIQAIVRELTILEKITVVENNYILNEKILRYSTNIEEAILMTLDSIVFPDQCTLATVNTKIPFCSLIQIHPIDRILRGVCILDFGLTEKQTIHLSPQKLIRIPVPEDSQLSIVTHVTHGRTTLDQDKPIHIPASSHGLVIDTRDPDILVQSSVIQAKALVSSWFDCFDIVHLGV